METSAVPSPFTSPFVAGLVGNRVDQREVDAAHAALEATDAVAPGEVAAGGAAEDAAVRAGVTYGTIAAQRVVARATIDRAIARAAMDEVHVGKHRSPR